MCCCVHDCNQVLNNHWLIIRQLVQIIGKRGYGTTYYFSYKIYNWCIGEPHVQFCFRFNVDSTINLGAVQKETSVHTRNLFCNYIWIYLFCSFRQLTQRKDPNWEKWTMRKKRPWRMQYPTTTRFLVTAVPLVAIHQLRRVMFWPKMRCGKAMKVITISLLTAVRGIGLFWNFFLGIA